MRRESRLVIWPDLHLVPDATAPIGTATPPAQIDQVVSLLQMMVPSVQPPGVAGLGAARGTPVVVRLMNEVLLVGVGLLVGEVVGGVVVGGVDPPPLPGVVLSQAMVVTPVPMTWGPGFLNLMAVIPSGTAQPLPEFPRNMVGRASKAALEVWEPPMVTVAHCMYISLFPRRLNQVHATTALPAGRFAGTLKLRAGSGCWLSAGSRLPAAWTGWFPCHEVMTPHLVFLVGLVS